MTHRITIFSLQAASGSALLNVEEGSEYSIGVSGMSELPTYLVTRNNVFYFQQFDSQDAASRWLEHFGEDWKITKL